MSLKPERKFNGELNEQRVFSLTAQRRVLPWMMLPFCSTDLQSVALAVRGQHKTNGLKTANVLSVVAKPTRYKDTGTTEAMAARGATRSAVPVVVERGIDPIAFSRLQLYISKHEQ